MNLKKNDFNKEMTDVHICFTNKTRKQVNNYMMDIKSNNKNTIVVLAWNYFDEIKKNNKWEKLEFFKSDYIASKDVNAWLGLYEVTK